MRRANWRLPESKQKRSKSLESVIAADASSPTAIGGFFRFPEQVLRFFPRFHCFCNGSISFKRAAKAGGVNYYTMKLGGKVQSI
jgi:hypothetical protein